MKILLTLFVLLFSSSMVAEIGDVYYCETNKLVHVKFDKIKEFKNEKFKFKRKENVLEFGSGGVFDKSILEVDFSADEYFDGGGQFDRFAYREGNFVYAFPLMTPEDKQQFVLSVIATCEIF